MNKKLIALAVAGACVAPTAMAQSANPITLYGALRMDFEYVESKGGTNPQSGRTRITDHPSLWGIRGKEDIGGGNKVWFQLESRFTPDQANGNAWDRNSGVGFEGKWGSIMMGRWDTPMKQTIGKSDLWGDINKADYTAGTMDQGNFARRDANVIQYWSPSWGGVQVKLFTQTEELKTATTKAFDNGGSISYSKGALFLAYAYEQHKDQNGSTVKAGAKDEGNVFAASFTAGNWKFSGNYGEFKHSNVSDKEKSYYLGGQYTMGKHKFLVTWQNAEEGAKDCDVLGVGWNYVFTKRTNIMLSYVDIDNSGGMNCNFGAGGGLGGGEDPKGFGIGVRHYF